MPRPSIVLGTRNPGKLREIRQALGPLPLELMSLAAFGDLEEPVEDGATFAENAQIKARYYARATRQWCMAEDSGLVVDALEGAPGVRSARYAAEQCPPAADRHTIARVNNAKLLAELDAAPEERRGARFVCHVVLADARNVLLETSAVVEGRISREAHGRNGFGYDPLFYVPELGCTMAELSAERKNAISHRGKAVRSFAELLADMLRQDQAG